MRQNVHDIISISNTIGYQDNFLTIKCNPQWPKVKNALLDDQEVVDRPDLAARVFCTKLRDLIPFVIYEKVFGEVTAHVRVINFQKRGLLHAHCIFFLTPSAKSALLHPCFVDANISAEIPSTENDI